MILPCAALMYVAMIKPSPVSTDSSFVEEAPSDALSGTVTKTEKVKSSFQLTRGSTLV